MSNGSHGLSSLLPLFVSTYSRVRTAKQTAKIAANCIRTLVLLATQPSATVSDQTIARALLPRLISFVTNVEPEDPENARALVAHTLCQYAAAVSKDHAAIAMALVVPALLARAAGESEGEDGASDVYRETSGRLLELASADQAAFRGVVGAMNEAQKAFMEEVIRSGRQSAARKSNDEEGRPTIELKMDFGG